MSSAERGRPEARRPSSAGVAVPSRRKPQRERGVRSDARILLADDHDIVRSGLRALLEEQPGWRVCAEAANGRDAVELALKERPDVAMIDVSMPELNGLEVARRICKALPETEVLMFTMHESEQLIAEVLAAGARGYLLKSDACSQVVAAVDSLLAHRPFFTGAVCEGLLAGFLEHRDEPRARQLSSREREVLQLLAEGLSNKGIATRLGLSVKTVETHRAAVMRKLGMRSIAQLVRYAVRNSLVEA